MSKAEIDRALSGKRRHKYGVSAPEERTADNVVFASKREMIRYLELKASLTAGIIRDLELQKRFSLDVNGRHVCTYVADFTYCDREGKLFIEDAKGYRTAMYRLKKRLFEACYPSLRISEI